MAALTEHTRRMLAHALRHPRGVYRAERASQLSGVRKSTIYSWRRRHVFIGDYPEDKPAIFSYRDLVLLRLLAWLRQGGMPRPLAAAKTTSVRSHLSSGLDIRRIHATKDDVVFSGDPKALLNDDRDNLLPSQDFYELLATFNLHDPIDELRSICRSDVWAPNLVTPSRHSSISPDVLAGAPCVKHSRIPTSAIYALRTERNLPVSSVVNLYPNLSEAAVEDVTELERRLRGVMEPVAA